MASKELLHQGELTKRSIKSKTNWKPRYFMLWHIEGGPPILEYYRKKGDSKTQGELVLGPGTTAEVTQDICKKSFFGMQVTVDEVDGKNTRGVKIHTKRKASKGKSAHLYCYAESYGIISTWVERIRQAVARAHNLGGAYGAYAAANPTDSYATPDTLNHSVTKDLLSPRAQEDSYARAVHP